MDAIGRCFRETWKQSIREENTNLNCLSCYDQHLVKKIHVYSLGKLNSMESCYILILGNYKKPTSQRYFEAFFESSTIDWKDIHLLECKTTINTKHRLFQYKILNNVVSLNKFLFKFRKVECPLCVVSQQRKQLFIYLVNV